MMSISLKFLALAQHLQKDFLQRFLAEGNTTISLIYPMIDFCVTFYNPMNIKKLVENEWDWKKYRIFAGRY